VIPTLLLAGLVVGRWWFIPVAGLAWAVVVDASVLAFALGAANTAVGVAVHSAAFLLVRRLRTFLRDPMGSLGRAD
jgi:hypothetical protein